jgi:uncharacterized protein (TIGR02246 family)
MRTAYAVILCVLLLLFSACAQKVNDPADVQAIKDMQPAWDKAWNPGNTEAVTSGFYTADAMRMEPNKPAIVGKDAIRAAVQKTFDQYSSEGRTVAADVRVSGDLAVAWGTTEGRAILKADGYSIPIKDKWVNALLRQPDGSWKIFWDIGNSDLPVTDSLPMGAEEQALMQMERDLAAWSVKNDWAAVDKMLAAEYANNVDGVITPKKQFLANMRGGAYKVASATAGDMKVLVLGETGIVHGLWTENSTLNGKDISGTYRYTDVFSERDGRWQCVAGHANKMQ